MYENYVHPDDVIAYIQDNGKLDNNVDIANMINFFTEMVIKECIELVEGYTKQRAYDTYYKAEEQIRAHFGVSE